MYARLADPSSHLRQTDTSSLQVLTQALNFALVLSTALMMWKGLAVACNTDSPVVVVLT